MSYQVIKEKLDTNKLVILDGAMGSELEKKVHLWTKISGVAHVRLNSQN